MPAPERLRAAERGVGVEGELLLGYEPQVREPVGEPLHREPGLELAQRRPDAEVESRGRRPASYGRWRGRGRSARGPRTPRGRGRRRPAATKSWRPRGGRPRPAAPAGWSACARPAPTVVAQGLVDHALDHGDVGDHAGPARGLLEQPADGVADEVVRRLVPGEAQREQDGGDLLVGQSLGSSSWMASRALAKSSALFPPRCCAPPGAPFSRLHVYLIDVLAAHTRGDQVPLLA